MTLLQPRSWGWVKTYSSHHLDHQHPLTSYFTYGPYWWAVGLLASWDGYHPPGGLSPVISLGFSLGFLGWYIAYLLCKWDDPPGLGTTPKSCQLSITFYFHVRKSKSWHLYECLNPESQAYISNGASPLPWFITSDWYLHCKSGPYSATIISSILTDMAQASKSFKQVQP